MPDPVTGSQEGPTIDVPTSPRSPQFSDMDVEEENPSESHNAPHGGDRGAENSRTGENPTWLSITEVLACVNAINSVIDDSRPHKYRTPTAARVRREELGQLSRYILGAIADRLATLHPNLKEHARELVEERKDVKQVFRESPPPEPHGEN